MRARACAAAVLIAFTGCGEKDEPEELPPPAAPAAGAETPPPAETGSAADVALAEIGTFEQPVWITQAPGGAELYVVEQCGTVRVVREDATLPAAFLDIADRITCGGERGLLSIAFAPDYRRSGLLYAFYTDSAGDIRISEFSRSGEDPLRADPGSERVLVTIDDPFSNHNGGLLLFDAGGALFAGVGDGGGAEDPLRSAQDPENLFGKLLRIDPGARGGDAAEVHALGLRNPWRFSFDRRTGDLWIGDVGQNAVEEINAVTAAQSEGANFGWSAYEGSNRFNEDQEAPGHIPPVHEYPNPDEGCSVTGGYVVRDRALPALYGRYLYADYCEGVLRSFTARVGEPASDDRPVGLEVPLVSSFGEDAAGRIYVISHEGPVYRLVAG